MLQDKHFAINLKAVFTHDQFIEPKLQPEVLLCFYLAGGSQIGCGEFLYLDRRVLDKISEMVAVNIILSANRKTD